MASDGETRRKLNFLCFSFRDILEACWRDNGRRMKTTTRLKPPWVSLCRNNAAVCHFAPFSQLNAWDRIHASKLLSEPMCNAFLHSGIYL